MKKPVNITTVDCPTCNPWARWVRSGSGAFVRQERHEETCTVSPRIQRSNDAVYEMEK